MKIDEILKKYRARLEKHAIIKALVVGLVFAFAAAFVSAFIIFMTGLKAFWISFLAFGAALITAFLLFYFLKFKPTDDYVAKKVDALGLEERVITMREFGEKTDYIYERQRADAIESVGKISSSMLKITLPIALIVAIFVSGLLGSGMTVVSTLSSAGIIKSGNKIVEDIVDRNTKRFFEVTYISDGGGEIVGEESQIIEEGGDATPVMAVADDEWIFVTWSDGVEEPSRTDIKIYDHLELTAIFQEADEGEDGDDGDDGEGDEAGDLPGDPSGSRSPSDEPSDESSEGAGGKYAPANQILDGETYYGGDTFDNYYGEVTDQLSQDGSMQDGEKEYINDYFKSIEE